MTVANKLIGRMKRTKPNGKGEGFDKVMSDTMMGIMTGELSLADAKRVNKATNAHLKAFAPKRP